ncbi:formyltransferase family protein [Endozoicomonas sp.]|uniref:formyltransferase family protein n=1 Tax=Endozoicomonas sp. TaxID=1892382 RepID=UPI003AF47A43
MNIIIAGKNNIAVDVAAYIIKKFPLHCVFSVINRTDKGIDGFQRSFAKFSEQNSIPVITLEEAYSLENSVFLSLEFDRIVKPELFKHDNLYNIHFSLLPKYKGMYTSVWPILNGEDKSGVTLHKIDSGIDTGDIISQLDFNLDENETAKSLYLKYITHGTRLVIKNIESLISGEVNSTPQRFRNSSYYSQKSIDYSNLMFDFNKSAFEIANQIKAFTFRDYQLPNIGGHSIFGVKILEHRSTEKSGKLINEDDDKLIFSTIDYNLCLYKDSLEKMLKACKAGDKELINKLSENSFLINEKNSKGWSPIIVAAYYGFIDIVSILVSKGAAINDQNNKGTTVLMFAKDYLEKSGDTKLIEEIIDMGGKIDIRDYCGLTVKDYVVQNGNHISKSFFESI